VKINGLEKIMSKDVLTIKLLYNVKNDEFKCETDIKEDKLSEIISDFLRTQMGLGSDERKANELDTYEITLTLDLADGDTFHLKSNTGNDGLTTGIILEYFNRIKKET
jgi:hypothetical protein